MEGPVIDTILAVEIMDIGLNVRLYRVQIHVADMEEHGGRLHQIQFFITHLIGNTAAACYITVAGAINHHCALDNFQATLGAYQHAGDGIVLQNRTEKIGMVQDLYPCFCKHFIHDQLQAFRLKGSYMFMTDFNPGSEGSAAMNLSGMDRKASYYHSLHDFFKQATDDHGFTLGIIASHKRTNQASGRHAAAESALLHQNNTNTFTGRSDCRTHTGRAAANDHNISAEMLINRSDIQLIHPTRPPIRNQRSLTLSRSTI